MRPVCQKWTSELGEDEFVLLHENDDGIAS
jgi:hypothetical protein